MQKAPYKRDLPVSLTTDKRLQYGALMAAKHKEREAVNAAKKLVTSEYKARLSKIDADIARYSEAIDKGAELISVDVVERFANGVVEIIRLDTNVVCDSRPFTDADRQDELPFDDVDGDVATVLQFVPRDGAAPSAIEARADGVGDTAISSVGEQVFHAGGIGNVVDSDRDQAELDAAHAARREAAEAARQGEPGKARRPRRKRTKE